MMFSMPGGSRAAQLAAKKFQGRGGGPVGEKGNCGDRSSARGESARAETKEHGGGCGADGKACPIMKQLKAKGVL